MEIQWFSKEMQGIATIYETNITLNTIAAQHFTNSYATLIGFDVKNTTLLIKSLNKEEAINSKYSESDLHRISVKPSYGRINGKSIIKNICKFFPLDFSTNNLHKYKCDWNGEHKCLIVYLKEEAL